MKSLKPDSKWELSLTHILVAQFESPYHLTKPQMVSTVY